MYEDYIPKKQPKPKVEQAETNMPWHKLADETETAFQAFDIFRMIGFTRTLEQVARHMYGDDKWEANMRHVEKWYHDHNWQDRAEKFDHFVSQQDEEFVADQTRRTRVKFAENLPAIGEQTIQAALGHINPTKQQQNAGFRIMDAIGPAKQQPQTNIYNANTNVNVQAPKLPEEVEQHFEAEEAEFEELYKNQDGPDSLKNSSE